MKKPAHPAVEQVVLLLVSGLSEPDARKAAIGQLAVPAGEADAIVEAAQRQILLAARGDRAEALGRAVTRLEDLYRRAVQSADNRVALQTQKEINRLLDLYNVAPPPNTTPEDHARTRMELEAIAAHLLPLRLAPPDAPLAEHMRVAVERLLGNGEAAR
jgi:hypothetical protein